MSSDFRTRVLALDNHNWMVLTIRYLRPNTTYALQIYAANSLGPSDESTTVMFTTGAYICLSIINLVPYLTKQLYSQHTVSEWAPYEDIVQQQSSDGSSVFRGVAFISGISVAAVFLVVIIVAVICLLCRKRNVVSKVNLHCILWYLTCFCYVPFHTYKLYCM